MRNHRHLWALAAAALLASCADYSVPDSVLYGTAVYTQPSPSATFAGKGLTYFLNPNYKKMDGKLETSIALPASVTDAIVRNMEDVYGYTPAGAPGAADQADVMLNVTVLTGDVAVYYPGGWCSYYYYYYCYYDWYYAGSYDVGMAVVEMGDLSTATPECIAARDCKLPILWTGLLYGVATTGLTDEARVVEGINRAYGQSTYLKTN